MRERFNYNNVLKEYENHKDDGEEKAEKEEKVEERGRD